MLNKIFLIIIILIITALLLTWNFAVPHYNCDDCKFHFWGNKYYHKEDCIQNCTKFSYSPKNRFFCAKVFINDPNNLDSNTYKLCTPCVNNPLYKNPVKYFINEDSSISIVECDVTNSYANYQDCKECNPINKGQIYPGSPSSPAQWKRQYPDWTPSSLLKKCENIKDKNSCWKTAPVYPLIKNYINYGALYYSSSELPYQIPCNSHPPSSTSKPCCKTCKLYQLLTP